MQCLDAGWTPGLIGVTDEHGRDWGHPEGKGRTGLFVTELSRSGVREALSNRRSFAARACADGVFLVHQASSALWIRTATKVTITRS